MRVSWKCKNDKCSYNGHIGRRTDGGKCPICGNKLVGDDGWMPKFKERAP